MALGGAVMLKDLITASAVMVVLAVGAAQYLGEKASEAHRVEEPVVRESEPRQQAKAKPERVAAPPPNAVGQPVTLSADRGGHFQADVSVNGVRFKAMVDTGATTVALPRSLAERLGFFPAESDFRYPVATANGESKVARVLLPEIRLQSIVLRDVEANIAPDEALKDAGVLLGMSFLRKLKSFSVKDDRLTLIP
jgi:aspartyl protease family protein